VAKEQVTVPDIGGATGAEVIELLVAVGDEVEQDQGLIVLESDKASMEIPSTVSGKVLELLVSEGQELAEGAPVVIIEFSGEGASEIAEDSSVPADFPPPPAPAVELTVTVPDIGTDDAVELIEVCVKVGDTIAEGDSLVVLESDKASMEVPAPQAGEVLEILVSDGASVRQGDALLLCRVSGTVESVPTPAAELEPPAPPEVETSAAVEPSPPQEPAEATDSSGKVYAGPAVRKLAREFGIGLASVSGTGPRGRVVKEDLHRFVQDALSGGGPAPAGGGAGIPLVPEVDFSAFGPVEFQERSKLDKLTATNMQRSWLNIPHVTQFDEADITELEEFRASLKAEAESRGTRLTPMPFLLKACAVALRDNPKFKSSLVDGGERLAWKQYCHIGMAVDTPAGLVVPVIRDADSKSVWELAEEVLALASKARGRKLMPSDMQGGCFTISSLGNIGGNGFTPIVNAPEVGILGVSRADTKPVWDGQAFVPRKMLPLSLSYDHRVINGGDGGRFLSQLVSLLGDIRQLVM
jgi:pyruvate dehydrogenase E2 component (dihydrolipoamide acetyltransferase)